MTQADRVVTEGGAIPRAYGPLIFVTLFDYSYAVTGDPSTAKDISSLVVPAGARVLGGWYEVTTTFTSSGSTATIALSLVGANDLVTAIAINDASAPWTIDLTKRRPLKGIATTLTTEKVVQILRGVEALTAGVLKGAVEWVLPANISSGH